MENRIKFHIQNDSKNNYHGEEDTFPLKISEGYLRINEGDIKIDNRIGINSKELNSFLTKNGNKDQTINDLNRHPKKALSINKNNEIHNDYNLSFQYIDAVGNPIKVPVIDVKGLSVKKIKEKELNNKENPIITKKQKFISFNIFTSYKKADDLGKIILALVWSSWIVLTASIIAIIVMSCYTYLDWVIFSLPSYVVVYTLLCYGLFVCIFGLIFNWFRSKKKHEDKIEAKKYDNVVLEIKNIGISADKIV